MSARLVLASQVLLAAVGWAQTWEPWTPPDAYVYGQFDQWGEPYGPPPGCSGTYASTGCRLGPCSRSNCDPASRHPVSYGRFVSVVDYIECTNCEASIIPSTQESVCNNNDYWSSDGRFQTDTSECESSDYVPYSRVGGSWATGPNVKYDATTTDKILGSVVRQNDVVGAFNTLFCEDSLNPNYAILGFDAQCYCPMGYQWHAALSACFPYFDRFHRDAQACSGADPSVGNPILPLSGAKQLHLALPRLTDFPLIATYDTHDRVAGDNSQLHFRGLEQPSFGALWSTSFHRRLILQSVSGGPETILASRGAGAWTTFSRTSSSYPLLPAPNINDRVVRGAYIRYVDAETNSIEWYEQSGIEARLILIQRHDGKTLTLSYTTTQPFLLTRATDQSGRFIEFTYEQPDSMVPARIKTLRDAAGHVTTFSYDPQGRLEEVLWPDLLTRRFLYERADLPWAITGLVDERGRRTRYEYDDAGRATGTSTVGDYGEPLDAYHATWVQPPRSAVVETFDETRRVFWRDHTWLQPQGTTVISPNGSFSTLATAVVAGTPRLVSQSQPAGSGCTASSSTRVYDDNGNVVQEDDFNGNRTCTAFDTARNLPITKVEGLPSTIDCSTVLGAGASLQTGVRKTTIEWHADWRLVKRTWSAGRATSFVYNGQVDPTSGSSSTVVCAPSGAVIPFDLRYPSNGVPLPVLCRQVEQATLDLNGQQASAATLDSSVAKRVESRTYDLQGHLLTMDGPRTDVSDVTRFTYYTDTTATHRAGDPHQTINAAGHVTSALVYAATGELLESTDRNGVPTVRTLDALRRLKTMSVANEVTVYDYDELGRLSRVTFPEQAFVAFEYDALGRLKRLSDLWGNRIDYAVNASGFVEEVKARDSGGVLRRSLARSPDALSRVQQLTGRP